MSGTEILIPEVLDMNKKADQKRIKKLFAQKKIHHISDDYEEHLKELFSVQNPHLIFSENYSTSLEQFLNKLRHRKPFFLQGKWIYFSWLSSLVHLLSDHEFQMVRTARNKNLINASEQKKFYSSVIGIGGLSVGNSVALAIVLQGGSRVIRIADLDRLALSNMNRIRTGVQNLGLLKTEMTARQIYEINPYARVEVFPLGLTEKNIEKFFKGPPKLDIMIDELDNLAIKYLVRKQAKKNRVPVLMGADDGDNAVVDIERYDLNPKTKFFHGRMGNVSYEFLKSLDKRGIGKMITKHIGPENVTERMQSSLLQIGKTIVSWPQLGGAAMLNGSAVALSARMVATKTNFTRNRALISLDEKLVPNYNTSPSKKKRKKIANSFRKIFGL